MNKSTKIWLIIAASLILIGSIIFGGMMAMLKWDFKKLSTVKYETSNYEIDDAYLNISITSDTADIKFLPSENSKTSVECYEPQNARHWVTVEDNTLIIKSIDKRKWYEYIGINIGTPKITLSIPQGELGKLTVESDTGDITIPKEYKFESIDISEHTGYVKNYASATDSIKIKASTGNIKLENITSNSLDLSVSTGKISASSVKCDGDINISTSTGKTELSDITCQNLTSKGSTGRALLKNVISAEKLTLKRSTGDINLDKSDAKDILIETDTGDVTGSLLSEKIFFAQSDTGKINLPKTVNGGRCEIATDTGDIELYIAE